MKAKLNDDETVKAFQALLSFSLEDQVFEPGHCGLDPSVAVSSHLVFDKILSAINVLVILTRAFHQRAVQSMRIGIWAVEIIPSAGSCSERTRAAAVMRSLWGIFTVAHHETAPTVT